MNSNTNLQGIADARIYLAEVSKLCRTDWPHNRTVNIVCHGHSVPSGYFETPDVRSLDSYPHLLRAGLAARYPHAIINVIVTAIGGEESGSGAKRFERDVLTHRPDVLTIDYGLNDRRVGLECSHTAWKSMIERALMAGVKVLLLTPTGDLSVKLEDAADPLCQHAAQIRELAREYGTGLVDSFAAFQQFGRNEGDIKAIMSTGNHPNRRGHEKVAELLLEWFP